MSADPTKRDRAELPDIIPAPRPVFTSDPLPYHQPMGDADALRFLARTAMQPGHYFSATKRR